MDIISLWTWRRQWHKGLVWNILPMAILGICVGWITASIVSDKIVGLLVGIIALLFVLQHVVLKQNKNSKISFNQLPPEFQTVIASVNFQYGNMKSKTPKFYEHITEGNWGKAVEELKNFGGDYQPRRTKEAKLMEQGVDRLRAFKALMNTPRRSLL